MSAGLIAAAIAAGMTVAGIPAAVLIGRGIRIADLADTRPVCDRTGCPCTEAP